MVQGMVAWGRLLHSRPYLCRAWVFWREGVVVSVKGQVGLSLVFWVLGERGEKNGGGECFFFPCSLRVQGKKKAYGAVQNDTVCSLLLLLFCGDPKMGYNNFNNTNKTYNDNE